MLGAPDQIRQGTELEKARYLTSCFAQELASRGVEPNTSFGGRFSALFSYGVKRAGRGACMDIEDSMIEVLRGAGFRHTAPLGVVGFKGGLADYDVTDVNRTHVGLGVVCDGQIFVFDPWQYGLAHKTFAGMGQSDPWNGMTLDTWVATMRTQGYAVFKTDTEPQEVLDATQRTAWLDADKRRKEQDLRMALAQQGKKPAQEPMQPMPPKFDHPGFSPELFIKIPEDLAETNPPLIKVTDLGEMEKQISGIPQGKGPEVFSGTTTPLYELGEQYFRVSPYRITRDPVSNTWKSDGPGNDTRMVSCDISIFVADGPENAKKASWELANHLGLRGLDEGGTAYTNDGEMINFVRTVGAYVYVLSADDVKNNPKAHGIATELRRVLERRLKQRGL